MDIMAHKFLFLLIALVPVIYAQTTQIPTTTSPGKKKGNEGVAIAAAVLGSLAFLGALIVGCMILYKYLKENDKLPGGNRDNSPRRYKVETAFSDMHGKEDKVHLDPEIEPGFDAGYMEYVD
eukprot:m.42316 g.42316  ORF g.42316 m.42316 type:complete len:122 (-) comp9870_c0_seq1:161-526(-)